MQPLGKRVSQARSVDSPTHPSGCLYSARAAIVEGYFLIHRSLFDHDLWLRKPFSYGQAWIDLIGLANHKPGAIFVRGNKILIQRGQVGWSTVKLADRWAWSRMAVRTFLKMLETSQQIEQQKNFITSIITIINYDKYQTISQQTSQQKASRKPAESQQKATNKECKRMLKNENETNTPAEFVVFWTSYPKKVDKLKCLETWIKMKLGNGTLDLILKALEWQKTSRGWIAGYVPHPTTYLNRKRWLDEPDENSQPTVGIEEGFRKAKINEK
jgi:hypothetical protein